jgi:hypothetical protein
MLNLRILAAPVLALALTGGVPQAATSSPSASTPTSTTIVNTSANPVPVVVGNAVSVTVPAGGSLPVMIQNPAGSNVPVVGNVAVTTLPAVQLAGPVLMPSHVGRKPSEMLVLKRIIGDDRLYDATQADVAYPAAFVVPPSKVFIATDVSVYVDSASWANRLMKIDLREAWFDDTNAPVWRSRNMFWARADAQGELGANFQVTGGIPFTAGRSVSLNTNAGNSASAPIVLGYLTDAE